MFRCSSLAEGRGGGRVACDAGIWRCHAMFDACSLSLAACWLPGFWRQGWCRGRFEMVGLTIGRAGWWLLLSTLLAAATDLACMLCTVSSTNHCGLSVEWCWGTCAALLLCCCQQQCRNCSCALPGTKSAVVIRGLRSFLLQQCCSELAAAVHAAAVMM